MEREFDCIDCGIHVLHFGPAHANDENLCFNCKWLRNHPDAPEEIKAIFRDQTKPTVH